MGSWRFVGQAIFLRRAAVRVMIISRDSVIMAVGNSGITSAPRIIILWLPTG